MAINFIIVKFDLGPEFHREKERIEKRYKSGEINEKQRLIEISNAMKDRIYTGRDHRQTSDIEPPTKSNG